MSRKRFYSLERQGNLLFCRVAVGQNKNSPLFIKLLIDTGSSCTVLPTPVLQRIGCNLNKPLRMMTNVAASGVITASVVAVPWFSCLGVQTENLPVIALNLPANTYQIGLLGMNFLMKIKAVIDMVEGEIRLKK